MSTTRVIYIVRSRYDESKAVLVVRENGVPVEVKDLGCNVSSFDVADILRDYTGLEFSVGRILTQSALNKQLREERAVMAEVTNSMGGDATVMQGMN
jgi:hypothetical protein